jgi:hypothetical protein
MWQQQSTLQTKISKQKVLLYLKSYFLSYSLNSIKKLTVRSFLEGIFYANFFVASCGIALALFFDAYISLSKLALLYTVLFFAYTFLRGWGEIYNKKIFDKQALTEYSVILTIVGILLIFLWYKIDFMIAPEWILSGCMFLVYCFLRFRMRFIEKNILFHSLAKIITVAIVWTMTLSGFLGFEIARDAVVFFFVLGLMIPFEINDMEKDMDYTQATLPQVVGLKVTKFYRLFIFDYVLRIYVFK